MEKKLKLLGAKYQEATDKIQQLEADLDNHEENYDELSANKNQKITFLNILLAKKKKK